MKSKKSSFKKKHSKNEKKENEIQMTSKLFGDYVVYEKIEPEKEEEEKRELRRGSCKADAGLIDIKPDVPAAHADDTAQRPLSD